MSDLLKLQIGAIAFLSLAVFALASVKPEDAERDLADLEYQQAMQVWKDAGSVGAPPLPDVGP